MSDAWTAEWIDWTPKVPTSISPPRSGHVAFTLKNDVYVFGGYAEESPEDRYPTNDLWKWDNALCTWNQVMEASLEKKSEKQPQQRLAAAAASLDDTAYIFGGWDSQQAGTGGVILNDIPSFTAAAAAAAAEWKTLPVTLGDPTSRLVAVPISDDTILIHNHRCVDHVLLLKDGRVVTQPTTGEAPSPRGLHAACRIGNRLVVFGGAAQGGAMSNEVFVLDYPSSSSSSLWEWKRMEITSDAAPSPRASPCFCALDDSCGIVFGGATVEASKGGLHGCDDSWLLRIEQNTASWELLLDKGPPGRNAATLTKLPGSPGLVLENSTDDDDSAQYFLLSGGWYPFRTTHADTFVLKVSSDSK
jgi:hypothetical protein